MTISADSTRPTTLLRTLTCATAAILALTACTDSSAPAATSSSSTSATPEPRETTSADPTPTLEPPAYPENIDEFTEENAIKFAEFYVQVINYATLTGDTALMEQISGEGCDWCADWSLSIRSTYTSKSRFEGFSARTAATPKVIHSDANTVVVRTQLTISDYSVTNSAGDPTSHFQHSTREVDIATSYTAQTWRADKLGQFTESR